jgi:hypothetical protein
MTPMSTIAEHDHTAIWAALADLADPEIPVVSLRELGILRRSRTTFGWRWRNQARQRAWSRSWHQHGPPTG